MVKDFITRSKTPVLQVQRQEDVYSEFEGVCPACRMPFDKGKKRKLIDHCGHERCYSCLFKSELCPVCALQAPAKKLLQSGSRTSLSPSHGGGGVLGTRNKLITNGTFTSYYRGSCDPGLPPERPSSRASLSRSVSPRRLVHTLNTANQIPLNSLYNPTYVTGIPNHHNNGRDSPHSRLDYPQGRETPPTGGTPPTRPRNRTNTTTTTAATVPTSLLLPKSGGGTPSSRRRGVGPPRVPPVSPWARRSPYRPNTVNVDSTQQLTALLCRGNNKKSEESLSLIRKIKSLWNLDDENDVDTEGPAPTPPPPPTPTGPAPPRTPAGATVLPKEGTDGSKDPNGDLYMRLGLLLGDGASNSNNGTRTASKGASSHTSFSSLSASSEPNTTASSNTSPVSTLTGSSEAEMRARDPSIESVNSFMSQSQVSSNNSSASPTCTPRRHSVTMRFASYRGAQLSLRPLFFEVPQQDPDPLFIGRSWLFRELEAQLAGDAPNNRGIVLSGNIGSGKTAAVLQMVEYSCFGRKREESIYQEVYSRGNGQYGRIGLMPDGVRTLASRLVAYHFCQADNSITCHVPDFVHSVAAQLCQAPQLQAYRDLLLAEPQTQALLSMQTCVSDPSGAFVKGMLEPLQNLRRLGKVGGEPLLIVVDGLCEAEYHRPDHADTLASFLAKHIVKFPTFLKLVVTVRSQLVELTRLLPFHHISLDPDTHEPATDSVTRDLTDFVTFRCSHSPTIRNNITVPQGKLEGGSCLHRFTQHVVSQSRGSMLFLKLILDLVERGHLVMKSGSFKVLPQTLSEIFLLMFNLRFPSVKSFEKVEPILNVVLSALNPLTLPEIYHSVNAGLLYKFLSWDEFLTRFKILNSILMKRLDDTYMLFHPAIREWLARRGDSESVKFLCEPRQGHACLALRMSRLEWPLDPEASLELGHHILKAHVYKNMARTLPLSPRDLQALWLAQSSHNVSQALAHIRNLYSPNTKVSRLLLLAGASPDYPSEQLHNSPILGVCSHQGHTEMVALLIEFGSDVNLANNEGATPLCLSASKGHCDVVRLLVQAGASLPTMDCNKQSALVLAAAEGHLNVLAYLLSCDWPGPHEVLRNQAHQALVTAASNGHSNVVEFLLDMAEVGVDGEDEVTGETALTAASSADHTQLVASLLRAGASITRPNARGSSPLICAVKQGHYEVAKLLLSQGVVVDTPDSTGRTPLMVAAAEGHLGVMELLYSRGASLCRTDREGLSPLSWACLKGHVHAVQYLADCGADLNHADKSGRTPLDLSAYQGDPIVVQFLLDRGSLLEHVDINGMRPLDRAISARNAAAVQCFLRRGAKLGPATWAMAAGKPNIMVMLLNKLQEDGVALCRKGRLKEAAHRFSYALRKLPTGDQGEHNPTFQHLRLHLTLNLSRCKRKMNELEEAIQLADQALLLKTNSYEAYYARARAKREARYLEEAVEDVNEAVRLAPQTSATRDVRRVLHKIRDEMVAELDAFKNACNSSSSAIAAMVSDLTHLKQLAASVDTLSEAELPMTSSILSESGYSSNI